MYSSLTLLLLFVFILNFQLHFGSAHPCKRLKSSGAANEVRTRDPQLGKLMLYRLSYCRIIIDGHKGKIKIINYQIKLVEW